MIDFGLSIISDKRVASGQIGGTPGYIAPEVLMHYSFDSKIDVYSCGIVLYFMLTGVLPFRGLTSKEVLYANKRNQISFDSFPWISNSAKKFIFLLTNPDPSLRPTAAKALKNKWFEKAMAISACSKTKSIEDCRSVYKCDSYGFCNALVRTTSNEVLRAELNAAVRSCDEEVKVSKVPELTAQQSGFLIKRESETEDKKVKKYRSGMNITKCLAREEASSDDSSVHSDTRKETGKMKRKSKFALKTQPLS